MNNENNQFNDMNSNQQPQQPIMEQQNVYNNLTQPSNDQYYSQPMSSNNGNKKSKSKLPLIIGLVILVVVMGIILFLLLGNKGNDNNDNTQPSKNIPKDSISIKKIEDYTNLINGTFDLSKNYILMSDLDLTDYCKDNNCTPIGKDNAFTGTFDCNQYTIKGYYYETNENEDDFGFFAKVSNGVIKNCKLQDATIKINNLKEYNTTIGLLVGKAENILVENSNVINGKIFTDRTLDKRLENIGLMFGRIELVDDTNPNIPEIIEEDGYGKNYVLSYIKNSSAIGSINISNNVMIDSIGGFVGSTNGKYHNKYGYGILTKFEKCYSDADIKVSASKDAPVITSIGGFAGSIDSALTYQCYSNGNIDAKDVNYVAGFVGTSKGGGLAVRQCFSTGNVIGGFSSAGFIGYFNSATGVEMKEVKDSYSKGSVTLTDRVPTQSWETGSVGAFIGIVGDGVENIYSTGEVIFLNSNIGQKGFFSKDYNVKNESIYYNNEKLNSDYNKNLNGLTSEEMKKKSSYPTLDFNKIWAIDEGKGKPYLQWAKDIAKK